MPTPQPTPSALTWDALAGDLDALGGAQAVEAALVSGFLRHAGLQPVRNRLLRSAGTAATPQAIAAVETIPVATLDDLVAAFEQLGGVARRRQETGVVFTPAVIADFMAATVLDASRAQASVLDPACGCGALLVAALRRLHAHTGGSPSAIVKEQLFGVDVNAASIRRARLLLNLAVLQLGEDVEDMGTNLAAADALLGQWPGLLPRSAFDVVIANPPYVRVQHLQPNERAELARRYASMASGNVNLYYAFFELAVGRLAPGGAAVLITPSAYLRAGAARTLRQWLAAEAPPTRIIDFGAALLFPRASTYTAITVLNGPARGGSAGTASLTRYQECPSGAPGLSGLSDRVSSSYDLQAYAGRPWPLTSPVHRDAVARMEDAGPALSTLAHIRAGVATLRNRLYILDAAERDEDGRWTREVDGRRYPVEVEATRPVVRVPDVATQEQLDTHTARIIYPYDIVDGKAVVWSQEKLEGFPGCAAYLEAVRGQLAERDRGARNYPQWFAYGRTQSLVPYGPKLLTPMYGARPRFLLDDEQRLFVNGCAVTASAGSGLSLALLGAVLNSGLLHYYVEQTSSPLSGGFFDYQKRAIAAFTLPTTLAEHEDVLLAATAAEQDDLLCELYGVALPARYRRGSTLQRD